MNRRDRLYSCPKSAVEICKVLEGFTAHLIYELKEIYMFSYSDFINIITPSELVFGFNKNFSRKLYFLYLLNVCRVKRIAKKNKINIKIIHKDILITGYSNELTPKESIAYAVPKDKEILISLYLLRIFLYFLYRKNNKFEKEFKSNSKNAILIMFLCLVNLIISHEIGHIYMNNVNSASLKKEELNTDNFAFNFLMKNNLFFPVNEFFLYKNDCPDIGRLYFSGKIFSWVFEFMRFVSNENSNSHPSIDERENNFIEFMKRNLEKNEFNQFYNGFNNN
ncbi:hypothetical protein [Haemophilus sputorum]